jgi:hypothetical protein
MSPAASDDAFGLSWRHTLHPFQREGVARLLDAESLLLADEMGLGKTIQAIAALRVLAALGAGGRPGRAAAAAMAPAVPHLGAGPVAGHRHRPARGPHRPYLCLDTIEGVR